MHFTTGDFESLGRAACEGNVDKFFEKFDVVAPKSKSDQHAFYFIEEMTLRTPANSSEVLSAVVDGITPTFDPDELTSEIEDLSDRTESTESWKPRPNCRSGNIDEKFNDVWLRLAKHIETLKSTKQRNDLSEDLAYIRSAWKCPVPTDWHRAYGRSLGKQLTPPKPFPEMFQRAMESIGEIDTAKSPLLQTEALRILAGIWKAAIQGRKMQFAATSLPDLVRVLDSSKKDATKLKLVKDIATALQSRQKDGTFESDLASRELDTPSVRGASTAAPEASTSATRRAEETPTVEEPLSSEKRYTNFKFFHEKKENLRGKLLSNYEPLQKGRCYQLEVGIRPKREGIPPKEGTKPGPFRKPKQKETVTIWVTLETEDNQFEIDNHISVLELPPTGESTKNASFRVQPLKTSEGHDPPMLHVRMYYKCNLLESVTIQAEVVEKKDTKPRSQIRQKQPICFTQHQFGNEYADFDDIRPRAMNIEVSKRENDFYLTFFVGDYRQCDDEQENRGIKLNAKCLLSTDDLSDKLVQSRREWIRVALLTDYAEELDGKSFTFSDAIRRLAKFGNELWNEFFWHSLRKDLRMVGDFLTDNPLEAGAIIQVSLREEGRQFAFPWALLYDRKRPESEHDSIDNSGFWGMRYSIEQRPSNYSRYTDGPIRVDNRINLEFAAREQLYPIFDHQLDMLREFTKYSNKIIVRPPITQKSSLLRHLKRCDAHILYFVAHGHTRYRDIGTGHVEDFEQFLDEWERHEPEIKQKLAEIRDLLDRAKKSQKSYIQLSGEPITYGDFSSIKKEFDTHPFVFLNICESAQVFASCSDSFIHFFIDRGGGAVIGTECSMPLPFVDEFGKFVLKEVLRGASVGTALLRARQYFMENHKNPLGLAYTLFGAESLRFQPAWLAKVSRSGSGEKP